MIITQRTKEYHYILFTFISVNGVLNQNFVHKYPDSNISHVSNFSLLPVSSSSITRPRGPQTLLDPPNPNYILIAGSPLVCPSVCLSLCRWRTGLGRNYTPADVFIISRLARDFWAVYTTITQEIKAFLHSFPFHGWSDSLSGRILLVSVVKYDWCVGRFPQRVSSEGLYWRAKRLLKFEI